jgi:hypothetical protein
VHYSALDQSYIPGLLCQILLFELIALFLKQWLLFLQDVVIVFEQSLDLRFHVGIELYVFCFIDVALSVFGLTKQVVCQSDAVIGIVTKFRILHQINRRRIGAGGKD